MSRVLTYIKNQMSIYMIFLMLVSSYIMIFNDARTLKQVKLNKEARFSFWGGIVYAVLALVGIIASIFM
ncbi:MAG TPA: hypothetical protein DD429_03760 [Clostridiaceae bacterium]|nr:hypothetical protein [Clostridiaceae bacterium]